MSPRLISPQFGNGRRQSNPNYGPGTVPVLDVGEATYDSVTAGTASLAGTVVLLDNSLSRDGADGKVTVYIGGSTLYEAATEVVAVYSELALNMPEWVASTNPDLATVLAEHFTAAGYSVCNVIPMEDVI